MNTRIIDDIFGAHSEKKGAMCLKIKCSVARNGVEFNVKRLLAAYGSNNVWLNDEQ